MRRAAAAVALLLAGCPLPQPLPDYPAGTITPPRILVGTVRPADTIILVGADCEYPADEPSFELTAQLFDSNAIEQIVARWFVNYDLTAPVTQNPIGGNHVMPAPEDPSIFVRTVPEQPFGRGQGFRPYQYPPPNGTGNDFVVPFNEAGTVRIVELLVSNNFQPEPASPPYRQPAENFEVQLHRWTFLLVPGDVNCGPHALAN